MTASHANDRRDATVAAVHRGPDGQTSRFSDTELELPIILVAALAAAGISVDGFITRLSKGSIWQDDAIRSADRTLVIQAYLACDGFRAIVQIGKSCWYHYPSDTIHTWGVMLPATVMAFRDVPLTAILRHPLLDPLPVGVRAIRDLNAAQPALGVSIRVRSPVATYKIPASRSSTKLPRAGSVNGTNCSQVKK
ncbi:hypothetical protein [Sphingomonas sp. 2378]|uniref:hypothetical protein n=1 Tax=Sphingomonas sp. 2378 TaxID=1219748 RepID=UPI00311B3D8D